THDLIGHWHISFGDCGDSVPKLLFTVARGGPRGRAERELERSWHGAGAYGSGDTDSTGRGLAGMSGDSKPLIKIAPISEGAAVSVISPASFAIPERVGSGL